jgi:Zn-dependent metalloprotease
MKKIYLALIGTLITISGMAQMLKNSDVKFLDESKNIFKVRTVNDQGADKIVASLNDILELSAKDNFQLIKESEDKLRIKHYRYQQFHDGVKVNGSQLILHRNPQNELLIGSKLVRGIEASSSYLISRDEAFQKALDYFNATEYYWEIPAMEALLKELKDDPNASYYPIGELVYAEEKSSQNGSSYTLNWKFDISGKGEKQREIIFVNASNGIISFVHNGIHTDASEGTAITRYHGERAIISDSTGVDDQDFILYDDTRGNGGIHTLNMMESFDAFESAAEFTDADNYWDNDNEALDEVAGDVHWGMEMTYDYYFDVHGRDSYNDNGVVINGYVHVGENWSNASWNGVALSFGDANNAPFTHISVIGHEFTHAVTSATANLEYQNESGALNESFSDVLGTSVWWFADEENANWLLYANQFVLRSLENPNAYGDPDTYQGTNWATGSGDNGGVHTNSGVHNYWFYLLSAGGSGVNDIGNAYEVEGIGIDKAAAIAYRNLSEHLTPTSGYHAARTLSILSAEEIYGPCSNEVLQVIRAWYAVGLGSGSFFFDGELDVVEVESGCFLTDSESLEIFFIYNEIIGCDNILVEGDTIRVAYTDNGGDEISEEFILDENMENWDEMDLSITLDLSEHRQHEIELFFYINNLSFVLANTPSNMVITNPITLEHDDSVGFEDLSLSADSFYVSMGANTDAEITSAADNTGSKGFRMTGNDMDIELIDWPNTEEENFTLNPEYLSEICFCVDASNWDEAQLLFDMKQLHSAYWNEYFGEDQEEFSSSMRLMVNGVQIGEQYHPTSYDDDPYLTHIIDLNDYAGTEFNICFQTKAFLNNSEDPVVGSTGDNTYLDNIRFIDPTVGIEEYSSIDFVIYPNPNSGVFTIEIGDNTTDYRISIIDGLGREVFGKEGDKQNSNKIDIDFSNFNKGIYIVRVQNENSVNAKKIVIQ